VTRIQAIPVGAQPIDRYRALVGDDRVREAEEAARLARAQLEGRVFWNVSSTARGGGVAEMLPTLIAYARGAGIDARWLVIEGSAEFFRVTKRLHHALHASRGDGSPLGDAERSLYEQVLRENAKELQAIIRPRDVVVLHDPQTAGLAPCLIRLGAVVIWRCHIGCDVPDEQSELGWGFLRPYLDDVAALVFSREAYIPSWCERVRARVIQPSIDPFSAKNQELDECTARAILVHSGLVEGPPGDCSPTFLRADGTPGRVDRQADIIRLGRAPTWDAPLVVQVSRWDPLKDHLGVMTAFADLVDGTAPADAELVLAGPNVNAVADDPEGAAVFNEIVAAWRRLSHGDRRRIQLVNLPMADAGENAAIVNALQRHAAVVVQKSLHEGFGLTVTEAMWKGRPIVAGATGGIQDQIVNGVHGLLVDDPHDLGAFGVAVRRLLEDRPLAERLGSNARERARQEYLGLRHVLQYARLVGHIEGWPEPDRLVADVTPGKQRIGTAVVPPAATR
jgi:trehalose synthase